MINFILKETEIYKAVLIERFSFFRLAKELYKVCLIFFSLFLVLFVYGFLGGNFSYSINRPVLGFVIMFFCLYIFFLIQTAFFDIKIKKPYLTASIKDVFLKPEKYNLAEFLSFESAKAINRAIKNNTAPEITSTHILQAVLKDNLEFNFIFSRLMLNLKNLQNAVNKKTKSFAEVKEGPRYFSESFEATIKESLAFAVNKGHERIELEDLFSAVAKTDKVFAEILTVSNLKPEDIENLTWWLEVIKKRKKKFYDYDSLVKGGTLAKSWTAGYTITLDKYSRDLTKLVKALQMEFVGHEEELGMMERVLATRGDNNVLLVGQPGVGKKSLVYHLTQKSFLGECLEEVNNKRVVELDMSSLLAQIDNIEEVEVVLDKIFQEATTAGNIILVIDGIDSYIGQQSSLGTINISGILSPYLHYTEFRIIGITSYEGLHKNIEKNAILSFFNKIEVSEMTHRDTLRLLEDLTFSLEDRYKIFIPYPALRQVVSMSERYFPSLVFPEKAIDLLKESTVYAASLRTKERVLLPKYVAKIVTQKTEIPVGEVEEKEKEILLKMEDLIHSRIVNQEEAVKEVCTALRRSRSEITVRKGPMGAFLFLGPTGVGKTETCKALAENYFGAESKMVRLDMSEFQNTKDIERLIGSSQEEGLLTTQIRENPFSLLLLDEFEKAHPNILNLFLQIFDEGHITDGVGRKVDFKNTIIIATSNAGYQIILDALKKNKKWEKVKQEILDYVFEQRIFRPELINRFDAAVVFTPLSKKNLLDIAQLMLGSLQKNLKEKGVELKISQELKEKIVELGYNPTFGAREMRRVIQEKVENVLATAFLEGKLPRGSKVQINPSDFSLIIK